MHQKAFPLISLKPTATQMARKTATVNPQTAALCPIPVPSLPPPNEGPHMQPQLRSPPPHFPSTSPTCAISTTSCPRAAHGRRVTDSLSLSPAGSRPRRRLRPSHFGHRARVVHAAALPSAAPTAALPGVIAPAPGVSVACKRKCLFFLFFLPPARKQRTAFVHSWTRNWQGWQVRRIPSQQAFMSHLMHFPSRSAIV